MPSLHEAAETAFALGQTELAAAIRAGERELRAELEAAKKNDERYRWLRSYDACGESVVGVYSDPWNEPTRTWLHGADLDAAIDAEMAKD